MSIETLPTEILIQILDDARLEVGDLAVICRVSRRWNSAVIPVLYKRFTFRYYHPLKQQDERKLESFKKYGRHVKYLNLYIRRWKDQDDSESLAHPDIDRYLAILDAFPEAMWIEHYDIDVRGISWPDFWAILNYLVSQKQHLTRLTVRRSLRWSLKSSSAQDLCAMELPPTPRLPKFTSFNFRVSNIRGGPDDWTTYPHFLNNLVLALGDSCRSVSNLQIYLKPFHAKETQNLGTLWRQDLPPLAIDSLKALRYEIIPGSITPSQLIGTKFEDIKILAVQSWVCGRWLDKSFGQLECGQDLGVFRNLEVLRITDNFTENVGEDIEEVLRTVTNHFPKLQSLVLEYEEKQFSVSWKPDGGPVWGEVPFVD